MNLQPTFAMKMCLARHYQKVAYFSPQHLARLATRFPAAVADLM